jgi:hypothetical protein
VSSPPPAVLALAARVLPDASAWTCLKDQPHAVWRATGPSGAAVFKRHAHARAFAQELTAYRDVLPRLAGAPKWLGADPDTLALSSAPGDRLSSGTHDPQREQAAHTAAGRFARALHDLPVPDDDPLPLADAIERRFAAWEDRSAGLLTADERTSLRRLAAAVDAFTAPRVFCHRDFTPDNWLSEGTSVTVIDFEHARPDAAESDLIKLRAEVWSGRPDLRDAFLAGYGPIGADARARLDVLLALHATATLAWAARHDDPEFRAKGQQALDAALGRR